MATSRRAALGLAAVAAGTSGVHAGEPWPQRTVRLILPGAPGGNPDIVARLWAQRLAEALGRNFVVDNRPGAAGIVGADAALNAPPDGQTLLFGFNQLMSLNPLLYRRLPYDPARATPIGRLTRTAFVMLVARDLPVEGPEELLAWARREPGKLAIGTSGAGSIAHLTSEMLKRDLGAEFLHVPYRATSLAELVGGQVQMMIEPAALAVSATRGPAAQVRALAQLGPVPDPALPGVPVFAARHPAFVITGWHGIWGPPGLDPGIVARLSEVLSGLAQDAWLRDKLEPLATYLNVTDPGILVADVAADRAKWDGIVRERGIYLD